MATLPRKAAWRRLIEFSFISAATARPASTSWNVLKTIGQTTVMWSVFLWLLPVIVYSIENHIAWHTWRLADWRFASPATQRVGALLFCIGGILATHSGILMARLGQGTPLPLDCPNRLVIAGLYRYVRNPMAMSSLAQGIGVGLWLGSPLVLLYVLVGALLWNIVARPWEERDMEARFGDAFRHYRAQVRCWIPRRKAYCPIRSTSDGA